MDDSTPSAFSNQFSVFLHFRWPPGKHMVVGRSSRDRYVTGTSLRRAFVSLLASVAALRTCYVFRSSSSMGIRSRQMYSHRGTKDGRFIGDQRALLNVISNVFIPMILCDLLSKLKHCPVDIHVRNVHVENVKFGRSANGITPSRCMIVVLQARLSRLAADMQMAHCRVRKP